MPQDVPLSFLRIFEAAGRTGSFRAAAAYLNLTPSAVSHAIRKLEQALGIPLFERDTRNVRLSYEGEALMRHVSRAFDEMRRGMEVVSTRGPKLLRLHCAPSFAAQWLYAPACRLPEAAPGHRGSSRGRHRLHAVQFRRVRRGHRLWSAAEWKDW